MISRPVGQEGHRFFSYSLAVWLCRDLILLWERCKLVSSANKVTLNLETLGGSSTYNRNSSGTRTEPGWTP